jgi:drug/metabolite transporter (DMT)-like permease
VPNDRIHSWTGSLRSPGVIAALAAALLFGASPPLAKLLLATIDPWLLAALLYLGSGLGLTAYRLIRRAPVEPRLTSNERVWLSGAVLTGGVIAPVLLMFGLTHMQASSASLMLNAEAVFTALLAWLVFRENFDWRIVVGMAAIVAGTIVLGWPRTESYASTTSEAWGALSLLGACLAWGLDNNLTRKVSLADPTRIATIKGLVAGAANLLLALVLRPHVTTPTVASVGAALLLGSLAYGASLSCFVFSLRHLGTARTGAYFSVAPFVGAVLSILLLHEPFTVRLLVAGALMAIGVWLHLTEEHSHEHTHDVSEHEHEHVHDEHHHHTHDPTQDPGLDGKHRHWHRHEAMTHRHGHYPDAHHRHHH